MILKFTLTFIYTRGHNFSRKLTIENVAVSKIVKTLNTIN